MLIDHCIHALNQLKYKKYNIFEFRFVVFLLLNAVLEVLLPFRDAIIIIKSRWHCHKFCPIWLKLHNLVIMVNYHHHKKERLDWMKSGQLLHPIIHILHYIAIAT